MNITSVATAYPRNYYPQAVLSAALIEHLGTGLDDPRMLERLHANACVDGRYLALPLESYLDIATWGQANNCWIEASLELGESAIRCALARAGLNPQELGAIFFVSVTGIASPSIDARLVNRLGLSRNIRRVPIFGLGCVGGAAGLARAADYVRAYPDQTAVLLAVEFCSLTLQRDDLSIANLISTGLFGDGAAAAIIAGGERAMAGPEIIATRAVFYPDTETIMGWDISERGFRIVLSREVPEMARKHLGKDTDEFLASQGLTRRDIGCWILHNGGPRVLEAAQSSLGLSDEQTALAWECLRKTGNLSSVSVLAILEKVMLEHCPRAGEWGLLAAMGPGFCAELILLRW